MNPLTLAESGSAALRQGLNWQAVLLALVIVLVTVLLAFLVHRLLPHASLSLLFLLSVLVAAIRGGFWPSLITGILSFLAYQVIFTKPYYTLRVADDGDIATLTFFLVFAVLTGNLASRMHREIALRNRSVAQLQNLLDGSRQLSLAVTPADVAAVLVERLQRLPGFRALAVVIEGEDGARLLARHGDTAGMPLPATDGEPVDIASVQQGAGYSTIALMASDTALGQVLYAGDADTSQRTTADAQCQQAAVALQRMRLAAELEQARVVSETEQLRSALLSSVSHDLRTPLATIIGSTTSLLEYGQSFSQTDRQELLASVVDEAQRLDRHIQNLLDMTRLGQGSLGLTRDWVDVNDIVSSAVGRLPALYRDVPIDIRIDPRVPLLRVHGALIEQALVNLLDNAVQFSPPGGRVRIEAGVEDGTPAVNGELVLDVVDDGPGIPSQDREKVFDMFFTARHGDRGIQPGTGLGLAICRGMVGAHQGSVQVLDGPAGRGTRMRIRLPLVAANDDGPAA